MLGFSLSLPCHMLVFLLCISPVWIAHTVWVELCQHSQCLFSNTLTASLWKGAVMNALRNAVCSVVSCVSCGAYSLPSPFPVLQQEPVNGLPLHHWWCLSLCCKLVSHLMDKRNMETLTSGLFLKAEDDFSYITSLQLPSNVNSRGKGRKGLIPAHTSRKICTRCNHSSFNYTFALLWTSINDCTW